MRTVQSKWLVSSPEKVTRLSDRIFIFLQYKRMYIQRLN